MARSKTDTTIEFLGLVDKLIETGIKQGAIEHKIGLRKNKISQMRSGYTSANRDLINDLLAYFPALSNKDKSTSDTEKRLADLEEQVAEQNKLIIKILNKIDE